MNFDRMEAQLVLHEGERLHAYLDTEDNWTIFVGYNLTGRGVDDLEGICGRDFRTEYATLQGTQAESRRVLAADMRRFHRVIPVHFPDYLHLDAIRQRVVLDMAFNMGFRALGFKKAIAAIKVRDWSTTVRELYASKWARQVGDGPGGKYDRCERLASMILTGNDFTK